MQALVLLLATVERVYMHVYTVWEPIANQQPIWTGCYLEIAKEASELCRKVSFSLSPSISIPLSFPADILFFNSFFFYFSREQMLEVNVLLRQKTQIISLNFQLLDVNQSQWIFFPSNVYRTLVSLGEGTNDFALFTFCGVENAAVTSNTLFILKGYG